MSLGTTVSFSSKPCLAKTFEAPTALQSGHYQQAGQPGMGSCLMPSAQALDLLLSCCEAEEECRLVVAACLGHLALVAPALVLPALQSQVGYRLQSLHQLPAEPLAAPKLCVVASWQFEARC